MGASLVRFIPRDDKYFALLSSLIGKVRAGAVVFVQLLADYEHRAEYAARIKAIEEECDDLLADLIAKLNVSFITPLDRDDIYALATQCDDIIDEINGMARGLEIYHAVALRLDVPEIAAILADSLAEVEAAFGQLKGHNGVTEHTERVRRLEKRGDVLYAEALHRLFTEETNAIEVIRWVSIYERLEDSIDRCKHLAQVLEGVVVKHA